MKEFNKTEMHKLRQDYHPAFYLLLVRHAQQALAELAATDETERQDEKRDLLSKLGIRTIPCGRAKMPLNKYCPRYLVHRAILGRRSDVEKYLAQYKDNFERDVAEGKLRGECAQQLELGFEGFIRVGAPNLQNKVLREDIEYLFSRLKK